MEQNRRDVFADMEKLTTPMRAIKAFCVECMGGQRHVVSRCTASLCPLFEFRMGRNPYRPRRPLTDAQLASLRRGREHHEATMQRKRDGVFSYLTTSDNS